MNYVANIIKSLSAEYSILMQSRPVENGPFERMLIQAYAEPLNLPDKHVCLLSDVQEFIGSNSDLLRTVIARRRAYSKLYSRAVVLLFFYLAWRFPTTLARNYPLLFEDIEPIYCDLGISPSTYDPHW